MQLITSHDKKDCDGKTNAQWRRQTHGHGNSMTNSAQRGRVGEKIEGVRSQLDHFHLNLADAKYLVKSF